MKSDRIFSAARLRLCSAALLLQALLQGAPVVGHAGGAGIHELDDAVVVCVVLASATTSSSQLVDPVPDRAGHPSAELDHPTAQEGGVGVASDGVAAGVAAGTLAAGGPAYVYKRRACIDANV